MLEQFFGSLRRVFWMAHCCTVLVQYTSFRGKGGAQEPIRLDLVG